MPRAISTSNKAEDDLIGIWAYSYDTWGEKQADTYVTTIETAIRGLAAHPNQGRDRSELLTGYRSVRAGHHIVFYTFDDSEVRIVRVLHEAMDFLQHLDSDE